MARNDDPVELTMRYLGKSSAAFKFDDGEDSDALEVWLPASQVEWVSKPDPAVGDTVKVEVPQWLAEDRGLV